MFYSWIDRHRTDLRVTFLNVGKADAIFLQPKGANGVIIDGGLANQYFDSGRSNINSFSAMERYSLTGRNGDDSP